MAYSMDLDWLGFLDSFETLSVRPRHGSFHATVHDKDSLQKLYTKAEKYVAAKFNTPRTCSVLYRDKSPTYFSLLHDNIMKPYKKDCHGDPKSPVNGRINGLFFTANVDPLTDQPPSRSIYGSRRFLIKPQRLLDIAPNAYFTDFYCVNSKGTHYVTLVLARPGSTADTFCKANLIPFDITDNPFFCKKEPYFGGCSYYTVTTSLWVEILVTENIDLKAEEEKGAEWKTVPMTGKRSGGSSGLVKNRFCGSCNI